MYKNGKYLKCTGSQTFTSNYKIAQLKAYINALEKAKIEVVNQKIKTKEEVKSFVEANSEKSTLVPDKTTTFSKYFSTKIDKIVISVLQKAKPVEAIHTYYIPKFKLNKYKELGYEVCADTKAKKMGIIDLDGNWIIQPTYYDLSSLGSRNYIKEVTEEDNTNILHWFDKINKKLIKTTYSLTSEIDDKNCKDLLSIKSNDKNKDYWLRGVVNVDSGKIIIPIEYENIKFSNETLLCQMTNKKGTKIFNKSGIQIGFIKYNQ